MPPDAMIAARCATAPTSAPIAAALAPEQLQTLQAARWDGRKINRAARVATFSGWTLAIFAGVTVLSGIFSLVSFLLGVGMCVVAWVELRGARGLRRLEPSATRMLGFNQLALAAIMTAYGAWGVLHTLTAPNPYAQEMAAGGQVAEMLEPIAAMHVMASVIFYAAVVVCAVVATGSASLYYFTRRGMIEAYLRRTPAWVVETMRAVG